MTSLIAPRYELPLIGPDGRMTREWYKFLVQIGKSIDGSGTSFDDLVTFQNTDTSDSLALSGRAGASSYLLFDHMDGVKPTDTTLLALWPGDAK